MNKQKAYVHSTITWDNIAKGKEVVIHGGENISNKHHRLSHDVIVSVFDRDVSTT